MTSIVGRITNNCTSLALIEVDPANTKYTSLDGCNAIFENTTNGKTLLAGCKNTIIPEGVTTIAQYAMQGFSDLTSIVIPSTVKEIKANAFLNCSNLETVEIKALTPPTLGTTSFKGTSASKKLYVELGYLNAYWANDAFVTAFGMENITIAPSDTKIWGRNRQTLWGCVSR